VQQKAEPIYTAFTKAVKSSYAAANYKIQGPPAGGVIDCGAYSNPDHGCSAADTDATTAVTHALLWAITGNQSYATKAIEILDHYANTLVAYTNSNAPLQSAWDCQKWPMAAEIIRYTNAGWPASSIQKFSDMLAKVILPEIIAGSGANGNWELSMIDGMFGIAVFNENTTLFNHAVDYWKQRLPAYFYVSSDGNKPVPPPRGTPSWYGQTVYNSSVDGICQETCRDFGHTLYGLASSTHAAETAHIQGVDLFSAEKTRLTAAMEFHSYYLLNTQKPPSYICGGTVKLDYGVTTMEIGYNALHNRMGVNMPNTLKWLTTYVRKANIPVDVHVAVFETLTHGANANK